MSRLLDIIRISIRQVFRQRGRYYGVIGALMLGTAGVIVIITVGRDVRTNLNQDLDLLGGSTRIKLSFFHRDPLKPREYFRDETLSAVRELDGVRFASVLANRGENASASVGERAFRFPLYGTDSFFWDVAGLEAVNGRLFNRAEVENRGRVCVIGFELAKQVFADTESAVGQRLSIEGSLFEIIGVVGGINIGNRAYSIIVPITTAQSRISNFLPTARIYLLCSSWDDVEPVAARLPGLVKSLQPAFDLEMDVNWEQLSRVKKIAWWVELFVYLAVAATLVLGGFGIWYGMMAAVTQRTREIGLKKAMGAEDGDILAQFLAETVALTFCAGALGVLLSRGIIEITTIMLGSRPPEMLFLYCVGGSLVFSVLLGVGAGLYPALRAARMDVVSAIRYE